MKAVLYLTYEKPPLEIEGLTAINPFDGNGNLQDAITDFSRFRLCQEYSYTFVTETQTVALTGETINRVVFLP